MARPLLQDDLAATLIYQRNLDAVTDAFWTGQLSVLLDHIALPNHMLTDDAEFVIASPDELLHLVTDFRDALIAMGADSNVRLCRSAVFLPGRRDMIIGQHDTYVLRDGKSLRQPYLNQMTLMRSQSGAWRGVRIEARTHSAELPVISPDFARAQRYELTRAFDSSRRPTTGEVKDIDACD